jgi:hypothetical protein
MLAVYFVIFFPPVVFFFPFPISQVGTNCSSLMPLPRFCETSVAANVRAGSRSAVHLQKLDQR